MTPILRTLLGPWLLVGAGLLAAAAPAQETGARWIDDSGVRAARFGRCSFETRDGRRFAAWTYRSTSFDPAAGPIWFVMHGASRDVERYVRAAAPAAERHRALAIAVHFPKEDFPDSSDYTLGGAAARGAGGRWRSPDDMPYMVIEHAFDAVVASLGGRQRGYHIFGHSAGAQFTHRLLTFLPAPRVLGAVAANAGWYTLPTSQDPRVHSMPYGLAGGPVDSDQLARLFETPLVVLLGENDTTTADTDAMVRGTRQAEAQGATRLERGRHYFAVAQERAKALGVEFAWRLAIAPRAAHDAGHVLDSAAYLTFVPGAAPCPPTPAAAAAGLAITEILADPPDGDAGDVNGDGARDPADDEFVEIVNRGTQPICLSGWTLGDAEAQDRHVFPLAPPLAPGEVLVVFGGGVPTGSFGGAQVQWSRSKLSLTNGGDVLTLRDASGAVVQQVSWGDCAGAQRAADHWPGTLGIGGSLAAAAEGSTPWRPHAETAGTPCSPGTAPPARRVGR